MKTLDEIFIANGTDKASKHAVRGHNYGVHYAKFFEPVRFDSLKLLEIGVGGGESIRSWLEYFDAAHVYGVDIVEKTNEWNTPEGETNLRYTFVQGPQESETFWACFLADQGKDWNIIIDDGSHENSGIITTFNALWPTVAKNGLYVVEDLNAGYTPGSVHVKPGFPSHSKWLHSIVDKMHTDPGDIESVYFAPELCILRKA